MIKNIQRTWFEVWGDECAQNQMLKWLLAMCLALTAILSIALVILALRAPVLIAVSGPETKVLTAKAPNSELLEQEVRRVISFYIKARHNWEWDQIETRLKEAAAYVDSDFEKEFGKGTSEQIKIAKQKKISQRFYPIEISLNLSTMTATVTGDRILLVDGLRVANSLTVRVGLRLHSRTMKNPEGVYVTSETLVTTTGQ